MTPRQLKVLDLIREHITVRGYSPTFDEIAREVGSFKAQIHDDVEALVDNGLLNRQPRRRRGLTLPGTSDLRPVPTEALQAELARRGVTLGALDRAPRPMGRGIAFCAADGCDEVVQRGHLMCYPHWSLLSRDTQDGLKRAHARRDIGAFSALMLQAKIAAAEVLA